MPCAAVMLPKFSAAKILPNPKSKNKRKKFIRGLSKHTASLHRDL